MILFLLNRFYYSQGNILLLRSLLQGILCLIRYKFIDILILDHQRKLLNMLPFPALFVYVSIYRLENGEKPIMLKVCTVLRCML